MGYELATSIRTERCFKEALQPRADELLGNGALAHGVITAAIRQAHAMTPLGDERARQRTGGGPVQSLGKCAAAYHDGSLVKKVLVDWVRQMNQMRLNINNARMVNDVDFPSQHLSTLF